VVLKGDWVARLQGTAPDAAGRILESGTRSITFDAEALGHWDSALIAFLSDLRRGTEAQGADFDDSGLPAPARRLLALVSRTPPNPRVRRSHGLVERVGLWAISAGGELVQTVEMVGSLFLRGAVALRGAASMRGSDLLEAMYDAGAAALLIVTVVNLLVGGILGFIAATELRQLGAQAYVANLVAIGMVREMAALMTAIIMAGRTGGAYAANISAMKGAEEIDALRVIGIPTFDYLILPKLLALTGMMPILYLYGCAIGILGGLLVAVGTLGVTPTSFMVQAQSALTGVQFVLGLAKSLSFGALIAIVACGVGLRAGRSAADVGKAATSAVVGGIVGVIALDAVFDLCANVLNV
jgi:phospholipid/cholesterol/gamma-HCH transport system permease protein